MLVQVVPVLLAAHCLGLLALSLPRHAATLPMAKDPPKTPTNKRIPCDKVGPSWTRGKYFNPSNLPTSGTASGSSWI